VWPTSFTIFYILWCRWIRLVDIFSTVLVISSSELNCDSMIALFLFLKIYFALYYYYYYYYYYYSLLEYKNTSNTSSIVISFGRRGCRVAVWSVFVTWQWSCHSPHPEGPIFCGVVENVAEKSIDDALWSLKPYSADVTIQRSERACNSIGKVLWEISSNIYSSCFWQFFSDGHKLAAGIQHYWQ
jgi:hypothetical protein